MNKQELIKKYEDLFETLHVFPIVAISRVLEDLRQLDEPQKVTVPQFVADWYEDIVDEFYVVLERLVLNYQNNTDMPICKWFFENEDALKILINMNQFGYEIEQEKQHTVVMKATKQPLYYNAVDKKLFFSMGGLATNFTQKQLEEAGFGEAFNSPLFEVEEVKR